MCVKVYLLLLLIIVFNINDTLLSLYCVLFGFYIILMFYYIPVQWFKQCYLLNDELVSCNILSKFYAYSNLICTFCWIISICYKNIA